MPDPTPRGDDPAPLDIVRLARAIEREIHVDEEHGFGPNVDASYLALAIEDHYAHDTGDHYLGHGTPVPEEAELPSGDARVEGLRLRDGAVERLATALRETYWSAFTDASPEDWTSDATHILDRAALAASEPAGGDGPDCGYACPFKREAHPDIAGHEWEAATPAPVTPTLDAGWKFDAKCDVTAEDHRPGDACHPLTPHSHRDGSIKWARRFPAESADIAGYRKKAAYLEDEARLLRDEIARLAQSAEAAPVDPEAGL